MHAFFTVFALFDGHAAYRKLSGDLHMESFDVREEEKMAPLYKTVLSPIISLIEPTDDIVTAYCVN